MYKCMYICRRVFRNSLRVGGLFYKMLTNARDARAISFPPLGHFYPPHIEIYRLIHSKHMGMYPFILNPSPKGETYIFVILKQTTQIYFN